MTRAHPQPRFLAFDEGPFRFEDAEVPVVGVMTRGALQVEAVVLGRVTVDGWDATEEVLAMAGRLPGSGPDCLLIDGIGLGGMNLVDLDAVAAALRRPVFGVTRRAPDRAAMVRAVARTDDPERRLAALPAEAPLRVTVEGRTLHVQVARVLGQEDLPRLEVERLIGAAMADGGLPEPLRLAHQIATAMVQGVSGTKA